MRGILCSFLTLTLFFILSCASAPAPEPVSVDAASAVSVSVTPQKNRSFFSSVDDNILELVEIGSPQSLKQAAGMLHKSAGNEYTDAEKCLLYVSAEIMRIVWPSEAVSWDVPVISKSNQYTGAVESARKGIYDLSTNNSDFLSMILPSLVLLTSSGSFDDYYTRSEKAISDALLIRPDSVLANYLMGTLCVKKNENEAALEYFKISNGKYSGTTKEIIQAIADTCFLVSNYELALSFGEELLSRYPQDTNLLKLCARSSYRLGDFDRTESFVVRILLLEPDDTEFLLLRARILIEKQDYIRASSLLDAYEKRNVTSKDYFLLRTLLLRDWNKNNTAALETISSALSLYPSDEDTLIMAAETASLTGSTVNGMSAMELSGKILENNPDNTQAMKIRMEEYVKNSDYSRAYEISKRLISMPSERDNVFFEHINICLATNRISEAMELASDAYGRNPSDENSCMAYIKVLSASGQKSAAMQLIVSLIPGAGQKFKSFLYFERSYLQDTEDAVLADLRSSLTANPRNKDSLYRLYEIYYGKKDWRRAQYYLKQVVALDPNDSSYLNKNSELDRLLGK